MGRSRVSRQREVHALHGAQSLLLVERVHQPREPPGAEHHVVVDHRDVVGARRVGLAQRRVDTAREPAVLGEPHDTCRAKLLRLLRADPGTGTLPQHQRLARRIL
jgi:hypothetical protein